jgi:hypothetical protein
VGVARGERHQQQVRAALDRALRAFQVWHQHRDEQSRQRLGESHKLRGIGELWQQPRGHEGPDFDFPHAGSVRFADPLALVLGRHYGGDALQPVPQADFADRDSRR